jgi:hypothetical protein
MLLSLLTKEEKWYFIDLLTKLIAADGDPSAQDEVTLKRLKYEMGDDGLRYRKSSMSLEKLIEYFSAKTKTTKNLVLMNLVGASLYDEFYSVEEHFLIEQIQESFGISNKTKKELTRLVYQERDLREKIKRVISE